ncbi:MAG TPA: aminotransferase class V-fold PLP-dependent enzyme [Patescibacteria group bacterium]|nr:aminotransferase class V-fold PLP-dependent enzyme [Patescibacteria group bacterium]
MRIETLAVHAGIRVDPTTGAVVPPLHTATTFEHEPDSTYPRGYLYSRSANPNRNALEECLSELEGGAGAVAFASASAATAAVFQALAPGDHLVAPLDAYFGTGKLLRDTFVPWGLVVDFVDMTDTAAIKAALRPRTKIVWVETPSNPLWRVTDVAAVVALAHGAGAVCVCDNTSAPILQRPLALGADLVVYATTKYLGGHGDVLGGAVVARTRDALFDRVRAIQGSGGAVPSPFDCWLVRRGIRTLPWRMRAHSDNALKVATFLATHPRVEAVHYPGLASHPQHEIARRQMTGFGGMLSVQVRGGRDAAFAVERKVRIFTCATSFGGTESLLEHRASVEGMVTRSPDNLLRLSIGLEHADDLIEDLGQALG